MNLELLKESDRIIFECIAGSIAYGTNTPQSDEDIRGIFLPTKDEIVSIMPKIQQVSDSKNDTTFYELSRFFELASEVNPNTVELLFCPKDCIKICKPAMNKILENRQLFISKIARQKFAGYAHAQIKKAKGQNKYVNNPFPKEHPKVEDFCLFRTEKSFPPFREIKAGEEGFPDLTQFSVSRVSYSKDWFRLYKKPNSKGVFNKHGDICFDFHSLDNEKNNYVGVLQYNKEEYDSYLKKWKSYWEWKNNRNEARWHDYDNREFECDYKNLAHCVRLMLSGKNILLNGEPLVRLTGDDLKPVRDVRFGKLNYDEIMKWVESEEKKFDEWYEQSPLPHSVDKIKIDRLYKEIIYEYILNN